MSLKKIQKLPNQEYLNSFLCYDEVSGELRYKTIILGEMDKFGWGSPRQKCHNTARSGNIAGHTFTTTSGDKSIQIRIDRKSYYVHRIIWKMVYGDEPNLIDHVDGNPINNRLVNLRSVNNIQNSRNTKRFCTNTSGHTGVSRDKSGKFAAYIWDDYKKIHLGRYDSLQDAIIARQTHEKLLNYHENHGRDQLNDHQMET